MINLIFYFKCNSSTCSGTSIFYLRRKLCPLCNETLIPYNSDKDFPEIIRTIHLFPHDICMEFFDFFTFSNKFKRLHAIADILQSVLVYITNDLCSLYYKNELTNEEINELIDSLKELDVLGIRYNLVNKLFYFLLENNKIEDINNYFSLMGINPISRKKEKLYSIESEFTDEFGSTQVFKNEGTPLQLLINFRNKYIGHGTVFNEEDSLKILNKYDRVFLKFFKSIIFINENNNNSHNLLIIDSTSDFSDTECSNEKCDLYGKNIKFFIEDYCPSCNNLLNYYNENKISSDDNEIINKYPYLIAYPYKRFLLEKDPYKKLHILKETFLNYLKYIALIILSDYMNSDLKNDEINNNFKELLFRPSFGLWNKFIRETFEILDTVGFNYFITEIRNYYHDIENSYDSNNKTQISELIEFRNKYLGHGQIPSDSLSFELYYKYYPILKNLLLKMKFISNYTMLSFDKSHIIKLMGSDIEIYHGIEKSDHSNRVRLISRDNKELNLIPFFVLPGEYFSEKTSRSTNLMIYEQNTGKRIIFFSPESIYDETSGKILDRLNILLSDKEDIKRYDSKEYTNERNSYILSKINDMAIKSLLKEGKVLEGVYQSRKDAELYMNSFLGSRPKLLFISAKAGSGKTNLLYNFQLNLSFKKIDTLFIRANRSSNINFKNEFISLLKLSDNFEFNSSIFTKYTQDFPLVILIDGGNEHLNPEEYLKSILDFLNSTTLNIKVIITWRVNSIDNLPEISNSYRFLFYSEEPIISENLILKNYDFPLLPMNKREVEGAWSFYINKYPKQFKPNFSFEELIYFDRTTTELFSNPLNLRIFLDVYNSKPLPKKSSYFNLWKLYHQRIINS